MEQSFQLFKEDFLTGFFDVGLEQHVVTFSVGLSCGGLKPFCIIPSVFLQRAYDQCIGGADGPVQCGAFNITFMWCLPNMIIMAPSDVDELVDMLTTGAHIDDRLICFRYPRGVVDWTDHFLRRRIPIDIRKGNVLAEGSYVALLGYGAMVQNCLRARALLSKLGIDVTVADARFRKPLDRNLLKQLCENYDFLVIVEEGSNGGFGSHVAQFISLNGKL